MPKPLLISVSRSTLVWTWKHLQVTILSSPCATALVDLLDRVTAQGPLHIREPEPDRAADFYTSGFSFFRCPLCEAGCSWALSNRAQSLDIRATDEPEAALVGLTHKSAAAEFSLADKQINHAGADSQHCCSFFWPELPSARMES